MGVAGLSMRTGALLLALLLLGSVAPAVAVGVVAAAGAVAAEKKSGSRESQTPRVLSTWVCQSTASRTRKSPRKETRKAPPRPESNVVSEAWPGASGGR